jgi:hypothetical protein
VTFGFGEETGLLPVGLPLRGLRVVDTLDAELLEEDLFNTDHPCCIFSALGYIRKSATGVQISAYLKITCKALLHSKPP